MNTIGRAGAFACLPFLAIAQTLPLPADSYGSGPRAVLLAHGGRFTKESWKPQAEILAAKGFRVLAIEYRGEGSVADILDSIHYLRATGAKSVYVIGGSMGGDYAAEAAEAEPSAIDRIVLLGAGIYTTITKMQGPKLFILARDDSDGKPRLPRVRAQYEKALGPKQLIVLDGSAHAQFLFDTPHGPRVMAEILRFLTK